MLSALPTDLASIQMTLTTKAGPPQASCWDLKALVLCLSAGPSLEGLDQKELGGAWIERLRGGLRPLSQVPREQSRDRSRVSPHQTGPGEDRRRLAWLLKELVINCPHTKTPEEDE